MESRTRGIFLILLAGMLVMQNAFADDAPPGMDADGAMSMDPLNPTSQEPLIDPTVDQRKVKEIRIDSENIEVGAYGGILSIEDFGTSPIAGAMLAWHFSEDVFVEAHAWQAKAGLTSYEVLSGAARLLADKDREMLGYDLSIGYNLFPGEAFVGRKRAFNTAFYVLGGIGSTNFGGEDRFTLDLGVGYRMLPTDWLAWHIGYRDHVFASDITGQDKSTHNIELSTGVTVFF